MIANLPRGERHDTYRAGTVLALLAALGWLARLILSFQLDRLTGLDAAGRLAWSRGNGPLLAAFWWTAALAALLMIGALLAAGVRLEAKEPRLVVMMRPAGVAAGLLIALGNLLLAATLPLLGPDDLLLFRWAEAMSQLLSSLGWSLLAAWTGLAGLAILRSGDLSRPLGWTALPVALGQGVLAVRLMGQLSDRGPAALALTGLWLGWLGWRLWQPVRPARQKWIRFGRREQWDIQAVKRAVVAEATEQLQALAWWQRGVLWGWQLGLTVWMPWLKRPFSQLVNLTRPARPWKRLAFDSLEEYAAWLPDHVHWTPDPLGGAFDFFPSLGHAAWQLKEKGEFRDDCDGLAYFSAANIEPFCDDPAQRFLVTVLINPFEVGWASSAHVMLFFKRGAKWRIISNQYLYQPAWETFYDALHTNHYVGGRTVLLAVVQDVRFRTVWWGRPGPEDSRPAALQ